jgi:hypothetical protein
LRFISGGLPVVTKASAGEHLRFKLEAPAFKLSRMAAVEIDVKYVAPFARTPASKNQTDWPIFFAARKLCLVFPRGCG